MPVRVGQVVEQDAQGPAVDDRVMEHERQAVIVGCRAEQGDTPWRRLLEVENGSAAFVRLAPDVT